MTMIRMTGIARINITREGDEHKIMIFKRMTLCRMTLDRMALSRMTFSYTTSAK
jgi:hypothetical protein